MEVILCFEVCHLNTLYGLQSQSNEPTMTKVSKIVVLFFGSFLFFHKKDILDEIFCNILLQIQIIFSIYHIICINF
jgi:hypothetical protein